MNGMSLPAALLRARLALMRAGPLACAAIVLCLSGLGAWTWLLPQWAAQERQAAHPPAPAPAAAPVLAPAPSGSQNLALFYAALGAQRHTEQQLKILFALAAKAGLTLNQGEYKSGYDKASRVATYEIVLPVKGSYESIWQFGLQALRTLPFAALDEISFRRDAIDDAEPEARLRLTLYLQPPGLEARP